MSTVAFSERCHSSRHAEIINVFIMTRCLLDARIAATVHVTKCLSLMVGVAVAGLQIFNHCQSCD